jgi:predicted rRNA methylase YqxC with S4 and FtsJ domains
VRADPRVTFVENANLKNMPASVASGPYSFFTIDVRFASSRAALRAIAFRCKAPAHGIAWVRPQFEAPVEFKNKSLIGVPLRNRAMVELTTKAHALGFQIVAEADGKDGDEQQVAVHLSLPA